MQDLDDEQVSHTEASGFATRTMTEAQKHEMIATIARREPKLSVAKIARQVGDVARLRADRELFLAERSGRSFVIRFAE